MDERDKSVHCKVSLSERSVDILCKMAEEDHVSLTTEIENAISGWYRMRHGFTGIEKTREIEELKKELAEYSCRTKIADVLRNGGEK